MKNFGPGVFRTPMRFKRQAVLLAIHRGVLLGMYSKMPVAPGLQLLTSKPPDGWVVCSNRGKVTRPAIFLLFLMPCPTIQLRVTMSWTHEIRLYGRRRKATAETPLEILHEANTAVGGWSTRTRKEKELLCRLLPCVTLTDAPTYHRRVKTDVQNRWDDDTEYRALTFLWKQILQRLVILSPSLNYPNRVFATF